MRQSAQFSTVGSTAMSSRSTKTFSQSSSLPTMIVQTGFISSGSLPSRSLCSSPRSTASATAIACAR